MELVVCRDEEDLAASASRLWRERLQAHPTLAMAVPAGRTPRRTYARLAARQREAPLDFSRVRVFAVDELCPPPAPPDGHFWRQVRAELLDWAGVPPDRCHPFAVDAPDLAGMCRAHDAAIARAGGLDLAVLGLGWNGHLAANEPGSPFDSRTRPVTLWPETVAYMRTDPGHVGEVSDRAVTLGLATIMEARQVVLLVSGPVKREPLRRLLEGPVTPALPASILQRHPRCAILADRDAAA